MSAAQQALQQGLGIAITGMLIVFGALLLITISIALLPRILVVLEPYLPQAHETYAGHGGHETHAPPGAEEDEAILAAIGFVLQHEAQEQEQG